MKISRRSFLERVAPSAAVAVAVPCTVPSAEANEETPVSRVNRLARELSQAMDAWMKDLGVDGKPDLWKAHIYPASFTKYPVSFEHMNEDGSGSYPPSRIEKLFAEWQAARSRPCETDDEAEAMYSEYRRLQIAIIESRLQPTSVRDMALQYIVDTDCFGSICSDHWENLVRDLLGEPISEGIEA